MTSILTEIGDDLQVSKSFKAGAEIAFGLPVKLSAAGVVIVGTATDSIGWAVPDDAVAAANLEKGNTEEAYAADELVTVKLKGEVLNVTSSAAIAVGDFVKGAAAGKYAPEATPTTKTVATEGIALTAAGGADATIQIVRI